MHDYLFDTNILSSLLDPGHPRHAEIRRAVSELRGDHFVSVISLAEFTLGARLAEAFGRASAPRLLQALASALDYAVLDVTHHTAAAYAALKTNMAVRYLAGALRRERRRFVEDWVDKVTGKTLGVDENDLWLCAQAKERGLHLVTSDRMRPIADADPDVRLLIIL